MQIAQRAYTAQREATSHFEASKKELPLKTKTTTTDRTETIKKMLSESGPESVLASKGRYSHTRTFAAGQDQRAVLAFSPENKRVDGFVLNKDQQLVPIKPYDLPKELQQILNSDAFEAFLNDVHARLIQLHNGDFRLDLHQGLKGGVYDENGNVDGPGGIKERLENLSRQAKGGRHESRIIIKNKCDYSLEKTNEGGFNGDFWANYPEEAFKVRGNDYLIPSGAAGGIFYKSTRFSLWGTKGYVSIRISTHGRNYIVICAFSTGSASRNSARIVIRCEDGATNELGVILGHGVDPTGTVTNRDELLAECDQHNTSSKLKKFNLKARMFNVYCQFENTPQAYFYFTFTNNEDASRNPNPAPAPQPRPKPDEDSKPRPVAPLVITIDGSLVDCFKTMRPGISERNHNPKTEKKAEMPVPDQEPVKDNLSGMSDNMQGDGDESAPGVPPQAEDERKVSNNSEYFENISTKASDFINNIDSEFISAAKPLANLLGKKLFDSPKEPKKEDKQNESSE